MVHLSSSPILIAGPTASGKSALAVSIAAQLNGWVINADSMQVYSGWHTLTARPEPADEAKVPHRLYGIVDPSLRYSVGSWLKDVTSILAEARNAGAVPVIVGGTGLYFTALTRGLSNIPAIPATIRDAAEARLAEHGAEAFRRDLLAYDPTAAKLDIVNPRRMIRAWEVMEGTGRSLTDWAQETPPPLLATEQTIRLAINADRDLLNARIEGRFEQMIEAGVMDEVTAMANRHLDPSIPAMKAVGAPPLMAHLRGDLTLEQAVTQAKTDTRRYAKRQRTWLRNQMSDWPLIAMNAPVEDIIATIAQSDSESA